jgi:hypothetical protein
MSKKVIWLIILTFLFTSAYAKPDEQFFVKAKILILAEELENYPIYLDKSLVSDFMDFKLTWDTAKNSCKTDIATIVNIYANPTPPLKTGYINDKRNQVRFSFFGNERSKSEHFVYTIAICGTKMYKLRGFNKSEIIPVLKYLYEHYKAGKFGRYDRISFENFCEEINSIIQFSGIDLHKLYLIQRSESKKGIG